MRCTLLYSAMHQLGGNLWWSDRAINATANVEAVAIVLSPSFRNRYECVAETDESN